ncbi:MAG: tetratricopeptide repeat protein [Pirellulales bacterium]|nr:tetratricopeptide repeat protein [Pirellulales bacterium]
MSPPRLRRTLPPLVLGLALGIVASARADEAADQYAVAAGHYARARWALAVEEFERFLKDFPEHDKAAPSVFFLGESLVQLGQFDAAEKRLREYLDRQPRGRFARSARFRAAEAAYLAGRWDEAKTALAEFRKVHPDDKLDAFAVPYLGDIALAQNEPDAAEKHYRDALARFPDGPLQDDCRVGLARALAIQEKNDEAQRLLAAVADKPGSPAADEARFRLGVLLGDAGRHDEAVAELEKLDDAPTESPWRGRAALVRASALRRLGCLDDARTLLESLTTDPELGPKARYGLGLVEMDQKRWDTAANVLLAVAAEHPRHEMAAAIRVHAGEALLRAGRTDEARVQLDAVLADAPPDDPWRDDALRAKVLLAVHADDSAALDRDAAAFLEQYPNSDLAPEVRRFFGRALLERKKYDRALDVLKPLVADTQPDAATPEDRYLLATAYHGCRRDEEALACLAPMLESATEPLSTDARLMRAAILVRLDRCDEAIEPLKQYLAADAAGNRTVQAKAQLAVCLARAGRLDEAKKLHLELLASHATDEAFAPAVEQLAEAAYAAGDYVYASELFGWLVHQNNEPDRAAGALAGLAWCHVKRNEPGEAAAAFQRVLQAHPEPRLAVEAAWAGGRILQQLGQADAALALYDQILKDHPKASVHADVLLAAARLRDQLEQDADAVRLFEQFVAAYPDHPQLDAALYQWSWSLLESGDAERSSAILRRLCQECPQSEYRADAMYRLAQRAAETKRFDETEQWIARLLAAKPPADLGAHALCLGWQTAAARQDWLRVRDAAEQLLADYPASNLRSMAEFWLAECAYREGDYAAAGRQFEELAKKTRGQEPPWLAIVPLRRAQILAHQGKWTEAHDIAADVAKRHPGFEQMFEVNYLLGRCLAARAEFEAAREAYRRVIQSSAGEKTETAAMAQWMIGETFFHQKDYESALREYLRVEILYAFPRWQAGALLQAGKCQERLGRPAAAAGLYGRVVDEYSQTPFVDEARQRLADLRGPATSGQRRAAASTQQTVR